MTSTRSRTTLLLALAALAGCGQIGRRAEKEATPTGLANVQVALGRSLEAEGDVERAIGAYREAIRRDPRRGDAPLRLAILLDRQGRFAESAPLYEAALKASPGNAEVYCDRGYSLSLQGKDTEAEMTLRQAIARRPDLARAHNNLGLVLARAGKTEAALAEFRKAGPGESDARLNLAFGLGEGRRTDEARQQLAIVRGLTPGSNNPGIAEMDGMLAQASWTPPALPTARPTSPPSSR